MVASTRSGKEDSTLFDSEVPSSVVPTGDSPNRMVSRGSCPSRRSASRMSRKGKITEHYHYPGGSKAPHLGCTRSCRRPRRRPQHQEPGAGTYRRCKKQAPILLSRLPPDPQHLGLWDLLRDTAVQRFQHHRLNELDCRVQVPAFAVGFLGSCAIPTACALHACNRCSQARHYFTRLAAPDSRSSASGTNLYPVKMLLNQGIALFPETRTAL